MAIPEKLRRHRDSGRSICRYEVEVNVSKEPRFVSETLWLRPPRGQSDASGATRHAFPDSPRPPAHIALRTGTRIPEGWRKVVSRGHAPGRVNYRAETSGWTAPFQIASRQVCACQSPRRPCPVPGRPLVQGDASRCSAHRAIRGGHAATLPPIRRDEYLPDGSNLPHVVHKLTESHPDRHERWIKHVREALPDIIGITTREREEDRHRYLVLEHSSGQETPSWLVSDGTLRLLALTLLAYLPDMTGIYLIEEPENGLHPLAVETVLQSLSSVYDAQILLTTHSPLVARLAQPGELLCLARDETTGTDMVRGTEHPRLRDWQGSADLGTLLASGVLG